MLFYSFSLKFAFKTANGREVFDGGGIDPDIKIKTKTLSYIASNLMRKDFIFDYATIYKLKNNHFQIVLKSYVIFV